MQTTPQLRNTCRETTVYQRLLNDRVFEVDNSAWQEYNSCVAKGLFMNLLARRKAGRASPLQFGTAFHAAKDCWFLGVSAEEQIAAAFRSCDEMGYDPPSDDPRSREKLARLVREYNTHMDMQTGSRLELAYAQPVTAGEPVPLQELPFRVDLGQVLTKHYGPVSLHWTGRFDAIVRYGDRLWVYDTKTSVMATKDYGREFARSSQMLGYVMVARSQLTPLIGSVDGVIIDRAVNRKYDCDFSLWPIPISDREVDEFREEAKHETARILDSLGDALETDHEANSYLSCNRANCMTKYGPCEYYDVCQSHAGNRAGALFSEDYVTSDWDPLRRSTSSEKTGGLIT